MSDMVRRIAAYAAAQISAADYFNKAVEGAPEDTDLLFNLGMVLAESDTPADALPYLQRFVRDAPRERYARDIARVRATIGRLERGGR